MKQSKDTAFVVVSCDKYSDMWEPLFKCIFKYWPDCPFEKYLITNHMGLANPEIHVIKIGDDETYSDNIRKALKQIEHEWVILWLDDVFIAEKVNTKRFVEILEYVKSQKPASFKFDPRMPMAYIADSLQEVGRLPKGIKYRAGIGSTFYNRKVLLKLLVPGYSAWELDRNTVDLQIDEPFYALTPTSSLNPPIKYEHILIKGRLTIDSLQFLRYEGFENLLKIRKKQAIKNYIYMKLYYIRLTLYCLFRVYWK